MQASARKEGPKLLVSVRDADEARLAIRGGVEILDIKEPRHGSLGRADDATISRIADVVGDLDESLPLSAALGELHEWTSTQEVPRLPEAIRYVKLGFSQCAMDSDWTTAWRDFRSRLRDSNPTPPAWVAVIYADWKTAQAPPPEEIIHAAAEASCSTVLVDTFQKNGRSLTDVLTETDLLNIAEAVHGRGLPFAVAGSLRAEDLPRLKPLSPQIVAIRSAACRDGDRKGTICPRAIQDFRAHMQALFFTSVPISSD